MFLNKENLKDNIELVGSLIYYKSPFNFRIRKYNSSFLPFMEQIITNLDCRYILEKSDIIKDMYVIFQNHSNIIYRAQIIDFDSDVES